MDGCADSMCLTILILSSTSIARTSIECFEYVRRIVDQFPQNRHTHTKLNDNECHSNTRKHSIKLKVDNWIRNKKWTNYEYTQNNLFWKGNKRDIANANKNKKTNHINSIKKKVYSIKKQRNLAHRQTKNKWNINIQSTTKTTTDKTKKQTTQT